MEQQVAAAEEADARDAIQAFLEGFGEREESTWEAVIECLKAAELEPPTWLTFLEDLGAEEAEAFEDGEEEYMMEFETKEESGEEEGDEHGDAEGDPEGEEDEGSQGEEEFRSPVLLKFIAGAKEDAGLASADAEDEALASADDEAVVEAEALEEEAAAGAAANTTAMLTREQVDERATIAARLLEEGRGLGLVTRNELQSLLQRCADNNATREDPDGKDENFAATAGKGCWEDWDTLLWMPKQCTGRAAEVHQEKPPPGMTPKEIKKWHKRREQRLQAGQ